MSDLEMIQVGTDVHDNPVYNVIYKDTGKLFSTTIFTEAEAKAKVEKIEAEPSIEEVEEIEEIEEIEDKASIPDYHSMTKLELEALMREHNIELDRRKSKSDLLEEVDTFFNENFA
tara:strand:+ start:202 stop:549 length:348 start_codon:yes stop_codon:yes gene_type:complete